MSDVYQTSFLDPVLEPEPLIATRRYDGSGHRHLALMRMWPGKGVKGRTTALCTAQDQVNMGAGTFKALVEHATCPTCKGIAWRMGCHPTQDSRVPRTQEALELARRQLAERGAA